MSGLHDQDVPRRLKERLHRPAIVIAIDEEGVGKGSGRSISGVDLGAAPGLFQLKPPLDAAVTLTPGTGVLAETFSSRPSISTRWRCTS